VDVTSLLADVEVPTLVLHSRGNRMTPFEQGRLMASTIPNAHFVPLDSDNCMLLANEPAWPVWLEEVTRFLARDHSSTRLSAPTAAPVEDLTEREVELLRPVAEGLTNDEIAARLILSGRTVERHLSNIYRKLGVSGRSARAAAVAHILQRRHLRVGRQLQSLVASDVSGRTHDLPGRPKYAASKGT
jgi:DNA-binding CsgD family transcriptional regulator